MLTCIACSKQHRLENKNGSLPPKEDDDVVGTPRTKQAIKTLTTQVSEECECGCFESLYLIAKKMKEIWRNCGFSVLLLLFCLFCRFK